MKTMNIKKGGDCIEKVKFQVAKSENLIRRLDSV